MTELNVGDTVRLKSGGPLMTVESIGDFSPYGPKEGIRCVWFDGAKKVIDVFVRPILEKEERDTLGF